jgi:putative membrane protein insertion efficiency factor
MTRILLATIGFYQRWLSPALHSMSPGGCKYLPTCSQYAATAIAVHGPVRGVWMAMGRVLRCHPFARGGLDEVPPRVRADVSTARHSGSFPHEPLP